MSDSHTNSTDGNDTENTDDAPPATTSGLEVIYGTTKNDPTDGLITAFGKLIADAGTVNLELLDVTIIAGDDADSDQQVAVGFEIMVAYEPPFERAETVESIAVDQAPADGDTNTNDSTTSDSIDDPNVELAPELQGATEAVVTFHPQIWRDNRAITGDETETYTLPIEDIVTDDGELPGDNTYESDALAWHEDAPKRAREWQGPFYVSVGEVR